MVDGWRIAISGAGICGENGRRVELPGRRGSNQSHRPRPRLRRHKESSVAFRLQRVAEKLILSGLLTATIRNF